ncbi:uncharacterized protein LOC128559511 [Mercenaria mercenaria]|uniref:uncharacterized protein LOC128559511 n=1 Tax=Mercenaria mercenaria TaxID=6596 RepID=UPI00234F5D16|nr:uncharacterized protein LOC128559511 [Mercenaria mercenaria]
MPLYLSELRLSIVTGIIGLSFERWRLYVDHIKRECLSIEYDMYFGNPNIAEYDPYAIHSDTKISYVQPKSYSSIISLVQGQHVKQRPSLQVPTQQNRAEQNYRQPRPLTPIPTEPKQPLHNKAAGTCHSTQTTASMYITPISPSKSDLVVNAIPAIPCRASPVPDYYQEETNGSEARPSVEERRQFATRHRQVIPERQPISSHQTVARQHDMKNPKYTNDLPISSVSPTIQTQHQHSREKLNATPSDQVNIINDSSRKSKEVINVEKLSINEVCEYLKVLKLDQYSETFRNDMIDGAILVGLTGSMLKDDFRMRGVEALRLLKFAKEGYIPA